MLEILNARNCKENNGQGKGGKSWNLYCFLKIQAIENSINGAPVWSY